MPGSKSAKLKPLEFRLHRSLAALELADTSWVIACSGGLDSIVLLHALARVASRLRLSLEVAYVHHGLSSDPVSLIYRDQAQSHVQTQALALDLKFTTLAESGPELKSEAKLRNLRRRMLEQAAAGRGVVLAHHADDLLETRILRLIRGTGPQGLRAMRILDLRRLQLRPFLEESRAELEAYARDQNLHWLEDPSNESLQPLRNWVRHEWLPLLEKRRQGAKRSMARSLALVTEMLDDVGGAVAAVVHPQASVTASSTVKTPYAKLVQLDHDFESYLSMGDAEQRRQIVGHLLHCRGRDFAESQVAEIQKRLNSGRSRREFIVAGVLWRVQRSTKWQLQIEAVEPNALVL